jgi:hypothetical protein
MWKAGAARRGGPSVRQRRRGRRRPRRQRSCGSRRLAREIGFPSHGAASWALAGVASPIPAAERDSVAAIPTRVLVNRFIEMSTGHLLAPARA